MRTVPPSGAVVEPPSPPPEQASRALDVPPWGLWTVVAALALGIAQAICAGIVVAIVARALGASLTHPPPSVNLIEDVVFDLSFVGAAAWFAYVQSHPRPADFGFRRTGLRLGVGVSVVALVGYYVLTAIYASVLGLHGSSKLPNELGVGKSTAALIGAAVFVCVIAPIAEEFFFRGFIFGALRRWRIPVAGRDIGTLVAAIVTGILFGAIHAGSASPEFLIPLAFLGFVLCLVRWRTRSLYPCMALHSFNNSLALGVNQLHWNAAEIIALAAGSFLSIAVLTGPLSALSLQPGAPGKSG